jgi:putative membrane protein
VVTLILSSALPSVLSVWEPEPVIWLTVLGSAALYAMGVRALRSRRRAKIVSPPHVWCFGLGLATLLLALASPLDVLNDRLFAAHMVQHTVLVVIVAPLLVLGVPAPTMLWGLPPRSRIAVGRWWRSARSLRKVVRGATAPATAWVLHALAIIAWHAPPMYQAAISSETIHALEHTSFLATAILFWWAALQPVGHRRMSEGAAVLYLFGMAMLTGVLGALLTFAPSAWYPLQEANTAIYGLTPLEDQQLAGLIMWIPAGLAYVGAAGALFVAWLKASDRRSDSALGGVSGPGACSSGAGEPVVTATGR